MFFKRALPWAVCIATAAAWPSDLPGHGLRASDLMRPVSRSTTVPASEPFDISALKFEPATENDRRGPCPALNVAANMGVLPRSGKNISAPMLSKAIQNLYNLGEDAADSIASGIALLTPPLATNQNVSLEDFQRHGAIEHDASITRLDYRQGSNWILNRELFDKFMADADGEFVTVRSMAKTRTRRSKESQDAGSPSLGLQDNVAVYSEAAIILDVFGDLGKPGQDGHFVPKKMMQQWFVEQRLPDGYARPKQQVTITGLAETAGKIIAAQELGSYAEYLPGSIIT